MAGRVVLGRVRYVDGLPADLGYICVIEMYLSG